MDNYFKASDILDKAIGTDAYFPIKSILLGTKTADVAPMRHGKWVSTGAISCKCSECHHLELKTRTLEYAYCPACGALMDGKEAKDEVLES